MPNCTCKCDLSILDETGDNEILKQLIIDWSKKSEKEDNPFNKFISIWISFNALYSVICNCKYDKANIDKFSDYEISKKINECLLKEPKYKENLEFLKAYNNGKGIQNLKYKENPPKKISNFENFKEVLQFIYQVRNNLFHGGKQPKNPRDVKLVNASWYIVYCFMNKYIKRWQLSRF